MKRVLQDGVEVFGRRNIIGESCNWNGMLGMFNVLPLAEESDEEVAFETFVKDLREHVEIADHGGLEDDGRGGGVEEFDGVLGGVALDLLAAEGQLDRESLEVDHQKEHQKGRQKVVQVRRILAVKGMVQGPHLVRPSQKQVHRSHHTPLEFSPLFRLYRYRRKGLPHDPLAHVHRDEERDSAPQSVAHLKHLVQHYYYQSREKQLSHYQYYSQPAQSLHLPVHTRVNVGKTLA